MAGSSLQEWLVDPLFHAAEEVQESADRLESNYRTWHLACQERRSEGSEVLRLKLRSSCDTLRWQLEVFERALKSAPPYTGNSSLEASVQKRRQEFVDIIREQLRTIELQVEGRQMAGEEDTLEVVNACPHGDSTRVAGEAAQSIATPGFVFSDFVAACGPASPPLTTSPTSGLSGFFGPSSASSSSSKEVSPALLPGALPASSSLLLMKPHPSDAQIIHEVRTADSAGEDSAKPTQEGSPQTMTRASNSSSDLNEEINRENHSISMETRDNSGDEIGQEPGEGGKTFPSLAGKGASRTEGWQCIKAWMHHFQRIARRRQLEDARNNGLDLKVEDVAEEVDFGVAGARIGAFSIATNLRHDTSCAVPVSRCSIAASCATERLQPDWCLDIPQASSAVSDDETRRIISLTPFRNAPGRVRKSSSRMHLSMPHHHQASLLRPSSQVAMVCAVALTMMVAVICMGSFTRQREGWEPRHLSLLEVSAEASSPAFP